MLVPLIEVDIGPKGRKLLWNDALEDYFKEIKRMVSDDNLLSYADWTIPFTGHTYASDKKLVAVISQNNKPIAFFLIILSKTQCNYTTNKKEMLAIFKFL